MGSEMCIRDSGYPRCLSNKADVLIGGRRAPIVGAVSMDMLTVLLNHLPNASVGDEVVLLGTQKKEIVTAEELADLADTVPYEILCGLSRRVPRLYVEGGRAVRATYPDALFPEGWINSPNVPTDGCEEQFT